MSFPKLKAWLASSVITLGLAALLFGFSNSSLQAQQDSSRQLVQANEQRPVVNRRMALVIGNGAYTSAPPLKNPPNDARDMAATLKALGFEVTSGINVNQREMKRLLREFGQKLKSGGSGLFYYAGHGVQSKGRNYLIPVDADIQSEVEAEDAGVDVSLVLGYMDDAQNGLNIVILDACRNNPFARSFRSSSEGLAQVDAPTGTLIAYATAPGRVASDGNGRNGLYTQELLKQMQVPGLTATEMFMRVRAEVMKQTSSKQVPWEASSLVGSFYFGGGATESTTSTPASNLNISGSRIDPSAFELSYWDTIKSSQSVDDFKAYLEKYPDGQFASLAKNRIANLQPPVKPIESSSSANNAATELAFWDSVKSSTNAEDYRAYLEKYPNGDFAVLAKRRLIPLEAAEKDKAKADDVRRNMKTFKGFYELRSAMANVTMPGTLTVSPDRIEFVFDNVEQNKQANGEVVKPYVIKCGDIGEARLDGVFVREIREGKSRTRFEAESAAAASDALSTMHYVCANPGANFTDVATSPGASEPALDSHAKAFPGSLGVMSAGFTARPGKLTILPTGIQLIWDSGNDGTFAGKPYKFLHADPRPYILKCSDFANARIEDVFIREIGVNQTELMEVIGTGGFIARFKASSPADATAALTAVREFCNKRP